MKMHSIESRLVIGPSGILFGGVYFQPGNFTGWGSDGVKYDVLSTITCQATS